GVHDDVGVEVVELHDDPVHQVRHEVRRAHVRVRDVGDGDHGSKSIRGAPARSGSRPRSATIRPVNLLDLVLVVVVVLAAINGYRRGAALQLTAYAGLFAGLVVGAVVAPRVAKLADSPFGQAALALITLIALA